MAEKMPSSVKVGSRPMISRIMSYSSGLRPWASISSGVIAGSCILMDSPKVSGWRLFKACKGQGEGGRRRLVFSGRQRPEAICPGPPISGYQRGEALALNAVSDLLAQRFHPCRVFNSNTLIGDAQRLNWEGYHFNRQVGAFGDVHIDQMTAFIILGRFESRADGGI